MAKVSNLPEILGILTIILIVMTILWIAYRVAKYRSINSTKTKHFGITLRVDRLYWADVVILVCVATVLLSLFLWRPMISHYTPKPSDISSLQQQINTLQPRHLSEAQEKQLTATLATTKGKVGFMSLLLDGESADFADDLATVFRDAGWDVVPTVRTSLNNFSGFVTIGVTGEGLDEIADFVCKALNLAGITCKYENIQPNSIGGELEPNTVYVIVGRK